MFATQSCPLQRLRTITSTALLLSLKNYSTSSLKMFHIPVYCDEIEDCPGMYSRFNALNGANKSQRAKSTTVKKL
ncbi:hypothetical protein PRIPAC_96129 [Pristionchus pacificus]|uniref:Uncharacterized protein n=1 Tax=Pristionchus pacificus TaxID=54126 RepID=A0A2A6CTQ4_PRIPA|nr:hypothetical protein PRIPAC_96129 [Pristionchus pacificus]|eukprot:PDM81565.1 hypothetical protein PRIPAC_30546 [Pristionchus pacificus]